jgi:hypothetical protein
MESNISRRDQFIQDLTTVRDSLTSENWIQGALFRKKKTTNVFRILELVLNDTLCMCAHGAVQRVVNPVCKQAKSVVEAFSCSDVNSFLCKDSKDQFSIWKRRPDYVRQDRIYDNINYGNRELHYLLNMVGLTIHFNDDVKTTLEMVKAKFDEAIELVKLLDDNHIL